MVKRGPQPVDVGALKVATVQWAYFLLGLRDGHRDLMQSLTWGQWNQAGQFRMGWASRLTFAKIYALPGGAETISRVFEQLTIKATKNTDDQLQFPVVRRNQRDTTLSEKLFDLKTTDVHYLFFPPLSSQLQLWQTLSRRPTRKCPQSVKEMHRAAIRIYRWLLNASPALVRQPQFGRALCSHAAELLEAKSLWIFPSASVEERRTSDDKRIEFFAKALAGLTLGISPATAARKLSRWKLPKLWVVQSHMSASHEA